MFPSSGTVSEFCCGRDGGPLGGPMIELYGIMHCQREEQRGATADEARQFLTYRADTVQR